MWQNSGFLATASDGTELAHNSYVENFGSCENRGLRKKVAKVIVILAVCQGNARISGDPFLVMSKMSRHVLTSVNVFL